MQKTANYNLNKPDGTDVVDISKLNENADIVDSELKKRALITQVTEAQTAAQSYADSKISALVNSAPAALDTLKELADALGDDPNFRTTILNAIATKLNSSAYTAADVLAKLKTVDGSGSGLDADLLDGKEATTFLQTTQLGVTGGAAKQDDFTDITKYSTYKSEIDSNGIATEINLKRSNGTLIMKSVLSGGTSPNYTTRTETYYQADGTTVKSTVVYALTYDSDSNVSSEVIN
ncbi:hypothetical protein [Clostridium sp.]|uniref:hypothetical protein n=1 Tax=Clostridium sp. TaxID=1506 RepID=UPI0035A0B2C5